jgi:hypothetical protein
MPAATRLVPKNRRRAKISAAAFRPSPHDRTRAQPHLLTVRVAVPRRAWLFGGGNRHPLSRVHGINDFTEEHDELFAAFGADCLSKTKLVLVL